MKREIRLIKNKGFSDIQDFKKQYIQDVEDYAVDRAEEIDIEDLTIEEVETEVFQQDNVEVFLDSHNLIYEQLPKLGRMLEDITDFDFSEAEEEIIDRKEV